MANIHSFVNRQVVESTRCFRITRKYYKAAVEYIALKVEDELRQQNA